MMHKGAARVIKNKAGSYSKRDILIDIAWSLGYTILIIVLIKLNIIRPVTEYF